MRSVRGARNALVVSETEDELTKRLRAARAYASLSRDEIASALGISGSTYDRIETGARDIRPAERAGFIDTVAELAGLPPWFFWTDLDPLAPEPAPRIAQEEMPLNAEQLDRVTAAVIKKLGAQLSRSGVEAPADTEGTGPESPARGGEDTPS